MKTWLERLADYPFLPHFRDLPEKKFAGKPGNGGGLTTETFADALRAVYPQDRIESLMFSNGHLQAQLATKVSPDCKATFSVGTPKGPPSASFEMVNALDYSRATIRGKIKEQTDAVQKG
jgi:hypothetical protein